MTTTNATRKIVHYNGRQFVVCPASAGGFCVYYRFRSRPSEMVWIGYSPTNTEDDIRTTIRDAKARGEF